ncbi:MAG: DUF1295 domain-containing protein [Nevskiaceae bacterium]|nr:MAG: DUF1295 domain-containing protein [Nevskiaceae bacterium]TBR71665.1 MAG: DUF1295 domain-containing protein [Nevskiaceae bacterium]
MNAGWALLIAWLLAALGMTLGWGWQQRHANAGIVDVLWAAGLGGSAVLIASLGDGASAPRVLLALCGGIWGARLAQHLWRRVRRENEDGRYQALRARWHNSALKFLAFFQGQAASIALFALPFVAVADNPRSEPLALGAGVAMWMIAVTGEALADTQLARFRADPAHRAQTCRNGLWRYSRHPNYFFEWLHWFTYVLLAIGSPLWALSVVGPLAMGVFLCFVSGIPFTEQQALRTRGTDYRDYQRSTSILIPWPPKRPRPSSARRP